MTARDLMIRVARSALHCGYSRCASRLDMVSAAVEEDAAAIVDRILDTAPVVAPDLAAAREAVCLAIAAMSPDRTNFGPTIEADNRVHAALDALIAAARADLAPQVERARCIAALERKVRRWQEPGGHIGKPTERKNDCDVLRTAIHVLYAIDPAQREEVYALVTADLIRTAPAKESPK